MNENEKTQHTKLMGHDKIDITEKFIAINADRKIKKDLKSTG